MKMCAVAHHIRTLSTQFAAHLGRCDLCEDPRPWILEAHHVHGDGYERRRAGETFIQTWSLAEQHDPSIAVLCPTCHAYADLDLKHSGAIHGPAWRRA